MHIRTCASLYVHGARNSATAAVRTTDCDVAKLHAAQELIITQNTRMESPMRLMRASERICVIPKIIQAVRTK